MMTGMQRLRLFLTRDLRADLEQLSARVETQRPSAPDPRALQPLIAAALAAEAARAPAEIAAALRPLVEEMVTRRLQARTRRSWRLAAFIAAASVGAGALVWWWQTHGAAVATTQSPAPAPSVVVASAQPAEIEGPPAPQPPATVILEQSERGFGLGLAGFSDEELARAVRQRLSGCAELIGAPVSFAVKDGWIWLAGEASAAGREAASRALAGLGDDVMVVNQIDELGSRTDEAVLRDGGDAG